ncbi:hypothetical protein AAMO2058_001419800 [Amorphochlora amoebiformis]
MQAYLAFLSDPLRASSEHIQENGPNNRLYSCREHSRDPRYLTLLGLIVVGCLSLFSCHFQNVDVDALRRKCEEQKLMLASKDREIGCLYKEIKRLEKELKEMESDSDDPGL